eukprot:741440-Hanusia_phi.AAC.1
MVRRSSTEMHCEMQGSRLLTSSRNRCPEALFYNILNDPPLLKPYFPMRLPLHFLVHSSLRNAEF